MAFPTAYTEKTLAEYMLSRLGGITSVLTITLGEDNAGDLAEAVNDALFALGFTDISEVTTAEDLRKLRALANLSAWQYVVVNFVALYDFTADGETYKRSQMFEQAMKFLKLAMSEWLALESTLSLATSYSVRILSARHIEDPYAHLPEGEENEA